MKKKFKQIILCERDAELNKFTTVEEIATRRRIEREFIFRESAEVDDFDSEEEWEAEERRLQELEDIKFAGWFNNFDVGWKAYLPDIRDTWDLSEEEEDTLDYVPFGYQRIGLGKSIDGSIEYLSQPEIVFSTSWFYERDKIIIVEEDGKDTKLYIIKGRKPMSVYDEFYDFRF